MIAAFGTADPAQMEKAFLSLYKRICNMRTEMCVFALTSERISKRLGNVYPTVNEAFLSLREESVTAVEVIPLLLSDGVEYRKLCAVCEAQRERFDEITIGQPVLPVKAVKAAELFDEKYPQNGHPYILIGHGSHDGNEGYDAVRKALEKRGRTDMKLLLLHDQEESFKVICELAESGVNALEIVPFMISAGHHIRETYEEIYQQCTRFGIQPVLHECGMGEDPEMTGLFI